MTMESNQAAQDRVKAAMDALKATPDDPILLAQLQHEMNKYSHNFSLGSTMLKLYKDLFQSMLQKF